MTQVTNTFTITATDDTTSARTGVLHTRRGDVETPAFMPVGTQAAVKTMTAEEVRQTGAQIILANTYHLLLRPGPEIISQAGGVHQFMSWDGPILTDSGGFQVFSLASMRKVRERGVEFRSHIDGRKYELTPESVLELQTGYQSDVIMPLDELAGYDADPGDQLGAATRTIRWLDRSVTHHRKLVEDGRDPGMLFGITQGGFDPSVRTRQAKETAERSVDGFSIGGLSVGETKQELFEMLDASLEGLPPDRPHYLMGVGSPEDIWMAVFRGVDMFDCVHPTRVARRGALFTLDGRVNIPAGRFRDVFEPFDSTCDCLMCQNYTAAYVHHLFRAGEMLAQRLASIHNLRFLRNMMVQIREAITSGSFEAAHDEFLARYARVDERVTQEQRQLWLESRART
ncbi:MAG: tRNA guanosine(34) transglycosylase Tgt [Sphaerobacteraceae bacterium]|nr:MAG: tRNA guanosine(34) transglycosylase Tgt [Sphaerobacteraceae bacterium]